MRLGRNEILDATLGAGALFAVVLFSGTAALGPAPGQAGQPVLVIAAPWSAGAERIALQAGGRLLGPFQAQMGALAVFDGPAPLDRLKSLGAWSVHDGRTMALLCGETQND